MVETRGGSHILAGCQGGLYETNPDAPDPLRAWRRVKLPADVTTVYRIVTAIEPARIVIATDRSVWWGTGAPGTDYEWTEAVGFEATASFFGLARCDVGVIAGVRQGAAGAAGAASAVAGLFGANAVSGIYVGRWEAGDLVMKRSTINGFNKSLDEVLQIPGGAEVAMKFSANPPLRKRPPVWPVIIVDWLSVFATVPKSPLAIAVLNVVF